jgi:hypothetical protein
MWCGKRCGIGTEILWVFLCTIDCHSMNILTFGLWDIVPELIP